MKLVVSGPNEDFGLFLHDTKNGRTVPLLQGEQCTGLAQWSDREVIAVGGKEAPFLNEFLIVDIHTGIINGRVPMKSSSGDYHDIFLCHPFIYTVNTPKSRIETYTWDLEFYGEITTIPDNPNRHDHCHLNSVWLDGNDIYACAFCSPFSETQWRDQHPQDDHGVLMQLSPHTKTIANGFFNPHNVRVYGGDWFYLCDSRRGNFVRLNVNDGTVIGREEVHVGEGYLRGAAFYRGGWYLGLSDHRHFPDEYNIDHAKIVYLEDHEVYREWPLPVKEIYDIVPIP